MFNIKINDNLDVIINNELQRINEEESQNKELEKENVIRQIKEAEKNKSYYEVEKERLDRIINANLNTKKLQEEEKLLETKIKDIERNIEQKTKMIYKNFYEIKQVKLIR